MRSLRLLLLKPRIRISGKGDGTLSGEKYSQAVTVTSHNQSFDLKKVELQTCSLLNLDSVHLLVQS
jgi:hypothetical protein